jgi:hypothetical protein
MENNPYRSPLLVPTLRSNQKHSGLRRSTFARFLLMALAIITVAVVLVDAATQPSNCGGNTGAYHVCRAYPLQLAVNVYEGKGSPNTIRTANSLTSDLDADSLAKLFQSMSAGATYSIRNPDAPFSTSPREILIVCDTEFGNVPQPALWNLYCRFPAHAVGYSDGSAELITPAHYRELDKSGFVRVSDWIDSRTTSMNDLNKAEQADEPERIGLSEFR